jgi:GTP-binding protein
LVDTAGLRKTGKVDNLVEMFSVMRAKSAIDRADVVLMVLEAGLGKVTAQDRKIAALIEQSGRSCVVVANKCDLCEDSKVEPLAQELKRELPNLNFAPAVFISATEKRNLARLESSIAEVAANLQTEITTGLLNRVLTKAFEDTPPPVIKGVPLKLFYASLAGVRPPRVKLFVNRVESAAGNYLVFLKKRIRENFSLTGIPLDVEVVARPKKIESIRRKEKK